MRLWTILALAMLSACASAPDEQRLRDTIAAMETAIESGDAGDFADHVADDFSGQGGSMDRRQLRATLLAQTMRHQNISVLIGPIAVKLYGDRATATMSLVATGGQWLPETGRQIELESHWRIEDGEWICFRAEWR